MAANCSFVRLTLFATVLLLQPVFLSQQTLANSDNIVAERDTIDDEIHEFGKILSIEDSGFPMYNLEVSFPERNISHTFTVNAASVDLGGFELYGFEGGYATLYYLSNEENQLMDLRFEGKSLLGEYAPEIDPQWQKFTGKLEGAQIETRGDLPDAIFITDRNKKTMRFEFFITPEIVSANGKDVTIYFDLRFVDIITYLRPAQD